MKERRKFIRLSSALTVSYQKTKDLLRSLSKSQDISKGGIRLAVFQKLECADILEIRISIQDKNPIFCIGKVVWVKERAQDHDFPFEVGIKFIEIAPPDRAVLYDYLRHLYKGNSSSRVEWLD